MFSQPWAAIFLDLFYTNDFNPKLYSFTQELPYNRLI